MPTSEWVAIRVRKNQMTIQRRMEPKNVSWSRESEGMSKSGDDFGRWVIATSYDFAAFVRSLSCRWDWIGATRRTRRGWRTDARTDGRTTMTARWFVQWACEQLKVRVNGVIQSRKCFPGSSSWRRWGQNHQFHIGAEIARLVSFTFTLQFIARIHPDLNAGPPPPLNPESVLSSPPPPTIKDFEIVQGLVSVLCEAYGQEMRKFVVLAGKSLKLEYLRKMFSCLGGIGRQKVEKSWANASNESFILFNNDNSDFNTCLSWPFSAATHSSSQSCSSYASHGEVLRATLKWIAHLVGFCCWPESMRWHHKYHEFNGFELHSRSSAPKKHL